MKLEEIFNKGENGALTYAEFSKLIDENGIKLADLSEGNYISKQKYEDELNGKIREIETLNGTISTRDTDLADLQKKLEEAGTDAEKLSSLTSEFDGLKSKYDADVKTYKAQLKKQAYEFAVKEFANGQKFSSKASKRDFINSMIAKDLKMEDGKIMGADDFLKIYSEDNEDAFVVENPKNDEPPKPQFTGNTQGGGEPQGDDNPFVNAFNFVGVREHPEK